MSRNEFERLMLQESEVYYNGKLMKKKDADKLRRAEERKKNAKKRKKYDPTAIQILPQAIHEFTRHFKLCKSLMAYQEHGYRQWGNKIYLVTKDKNIERPYTKFVKSAHDIQTNLETIEKMAKRNDKDVFAFVEKLHYAIDDTVSNLDALSEGVSKSGVLNDPYLSKFELIQGSKADEKGQKKRLGLKDLMPKVSATLMIMRNTMLMLEAVCKNGVDVMDYDADNKHTCCYSERGMVKHGF